MKITIPDVFSEIAAKKDQGLVDQAAAVMPPEVVEYTVLAGNSRRVAEQLVGVLRPEIGNVTIRPHSVAGESVESVLHAFAADVMPTVERLLDERETT
jgi:hypothetical protein